ncbi:MAG: 1,4-dihydroxy-2-naphthoate octaprenyltransferase, partial [Bacteroidia bacterium]
MSVAKNWIDAARPRTLPLALAGLALGNLLAFENNKFSILICVLSILTATFLQILSNFANDYGDFVNGADNDARIGPARAVQSGAISTKTMKTAIITTALLSLITGILLLWVSSKNVNLVWLLIMLASGLLAIAAAYKYTASKNPYGYKGYGDIAVFIFFGLLAVMGIYFLQTNSLNLTMLLPASAFGLLSTGVLNLNNMRDI